MEENRKRYIGLDVHKHYLIALGVDADLNDVLPARRVELFRLKAWMKKNLTKQDEVVLDTPGPTAGTMILSVTRLRQMRSVGMGAEMDGDAQRNRQEKKNALVAGAFRRKRTSLY